MDNNQYPTPANDPQPIAPLPQAPQQPIPAAADPVLITPNVPEPTVRLAAEPTIIAPTAAVDVPEQPAPTTTSVPAYNSPSEAIQTFLATTATENTQLTPPEQIISPNDGRIIQTIPVTSSLNNDQTQTEIVSPYQAAEAATVEPIKKKRTGIVLVSAGVLLLLIVASSVLYLAKSGPSLNKRYLLANKGTDYSFVYYSDAVQGINIHTGNKQLTGDLKAPTSAFFSKYTAKGDCTGLGTAVKAVSTINIKGSTYKICGINSDKAVIFDDNQTKYLFEMYSIDKKASVSNSTIDKILSSYKITN